MSQDIRVSDEFIQEEPLSEPSKLSGGGPNPILKALSSARRHWLLVLVVWVVIAAPSAFLLWTKIKPVYKASAHVEFSQVPQKIIYDIDPIAPGFDSFLNTQAQQILSTTVLRAALADPLGQGLLVDTDSVPTLRSMMEVEALVHTNLIRVSVASTNRETAVRLASAVMHAYDVYEKEHYRDAEKAKRKTLEDARQSLDNTMEGYRKDISLLAKDYGTTDPKTFGDLRKAKIDAGTKIHEELDSKRAERAQLEYQRNQLKQGIVPTTMPDEEMRIRDEVVDKDPDVSALKKELSELAYQIVRQKSPRPLLDRKHQLEEELKSAVDRVSKNATAQIESSRDQRISNEKAIVEKRIASLDETVKVLEDHVTKQEADGLEMGRVGESIRQLNEKLETTRKRYDEIDTRLSQLEIEIQRPARISVIDETAEVLPDGVSDKRMKLVPAAILGPLFFGLFLAFLIDFISSRMYTPQDVEHGTGLRLLGSLPSLEDLKRGRITQEDFRESYRLIRATLAGLAPDGKIPKTLLVTSAQAAEGKTSLAVSLAASLAEAGERVLVIDGDVQARRVGQALRIKLPFGLKHVLLGERKLGEAVGITPVPSLEVLLSDRNGSSAQGLLNARQAARLIKLTAQEYDHVVIDSPPVLGSADALIWSQVVDGVVISALAGHSNLRITRQACQRILAAGGRLLGSVICNVSVRESYHSYSSYSSFRHDEEGQQLSAVNTQVVHRMPPHVCLPGGNEEEKKA